MGGLRHLRSNGRGHRPHGSKIQWGITAAPPATIRTIIVSPMIVPMPRMMATLNPDTDDGMTTLQIVSHFPAPREYEACLYVRGTAVKASSAILEMTGIALTVSIKAAVACSDPMR